MANKKKDKREKFSAKMVYINGMGSELLIEQTFYPYMIFRLVVTKSESDYHQKWCELSCDNCKLIPHKGLFDFFLVHYGYKEEYESLFKDSKEYHALISKAGEEAVDWWENNRKDFMKKLDEKNQIQNLKKAMREEYGNEICFQDQEGPDFVAEIDSTKERIGIEATKCVPSAEKMSIDSLFEKLKRDFHDNDYLLSISKEQKWMITIDTTREVYQRHKRKEYIEQFEIQLRQAYEKKEPIRELSLIEEVRMAPINGSNSINFNGTSRRDAVRATELLKSIDDKEVKLTDYDIKDNCWLCIYLPSEQSIHSYKIVVDAQCPKDSFIERIDKSGYKRIYITSFGSKDITQIKPCDNFDELLVEE